MATNINEKKYEVDNFSEAVQRKTTKFQTTSNSVDLSVNARFDRIGGVEKIKGYDILGNTITTSTSSSSTTTSTTTSTSSSSSSSTSTSTSTSSTTTAGA